MSDLAQLQALLQQAEAELANVLTLMAGGDGGTPALGDVTSKSKSGAAGSTSFTYVSLTEKQRALVETIRELKTLIAESGPGIIKSRQCGLGWSW